jgi:hypothetical protein
MHVSQSELQRHQTMFSGFMKFVAASIIIVVAILAALLIWLV